MGLLQPGLLLLGLAAAVPLVLHLFQRHLGPRMVFPALRYLRRAERESARKVKLRQILLMLLRMIAVLLIAFAAARPFMRKGGINHEPTAVVIILDNSMSSGAVSNDAQVLDVLKARALETLAAAEPEDLFWLVRAGSPDEPAYSGDAVETARRVRATEPTDAAADIGASIARARNILAGGAGGAGGAHAAATGASSRREPEIQLLSDLQATNFEQPFRGAAHDPPIVAFQMKDAPPPNRSIADIDIGGGIAPGANERGTLAATLSSAPRNASHGASTSAPHGASTSAPHSASSGATRTASTGRDATDANSADTDSANVRLMIDGRLAAAARTEAGATAILTIPARPAGVLTGWVEVDADALRADNRRYFTTPVAAPPAVALVRTAPFFGEALAALDAAGRIHVAAPGNAGILILPGGGDNTVIAGARTSIILPPESPLEIPAVNRRLASSGIPWSYALRRSPGEARFQLRDSTDALLRTLESAQLRNVYALQPTTSAAGDSVLLRLRDGAPWAVRGERPAGGRYILLASPLSEAATSIPTSAAMLPLLDRILRGWSAQHGGTEDAIPGSVIALPAGADAVVRPDSVTEPVHSSEYTVPARAGIYQIMSGRVVVDAFAVNTPVAESDLARLPRSAWRTRLPSSSLTLAHDADEWKSHIFRARLGQELWRSLLLALLVVLIVESMIAASGGMRAHSSASSTIGSNANRANPRRAASSTDATPPSSRERA